MNINTNSRIFQDFYDNSDKFSWKYYRVMKPIIVDCQKNLTSLRAIYNYFPSHGHQNNLVRLSFYFCQDFLSSDEYEYSISAIDKFYQDKYVYDNLSDILADLKYLDQKYQSKIYHQVDANNGSISYTFQVSFFYCKSSCDIDEIGKSNYVLDNISAIIIQNAWLNYKLRKNIFSQIKSIYPHSVANHIYSFLPWIFKIDHN